MEILNQFGVKPILLIAQTVNFLILLFVLKKILYKPILKMLDERKQKIAISLKQVEEIEQKLESINTNREKKLKEVSEEVKQIITEATNNANEIIAQAHLRAEDDIKKMIEKSEGQMVQEREKLRQDVRAELADLVEAGLIKVTEDLVTGKDHKSLIQKAIRRFE